MARKGGSRKNTTISKFYCTQCGKPQYLARKQSLQKEQGHLKKLHCPFCGLQCNHYEVREHDFDFDYESFMKRVENKEFPLENDNKKETK